MDIQYAYTKKRSDFGRQCVFSDKEAELTVDVVPDPSLSANYISPDISDVAMQCSQEMSEHEANTESFTSKNCGINHVEGGWPKEINPSEREQTIRYKKKVEKDENYVLAIMHLGNCIEHCLKQNNAINIYEEYFEDKEVVEKTEEQPSGKIINVFRDPNVITRCATSLSWHPDGTELAVAYSVLQFQKFTSGMSYDSYIWSVEKQKTPMMTLTPASPLLSIQTHPLHGQTLIGGSHNGQIAFWDTRKGSHPVQQSVVEQSHTDPVHKVIWLPSSIGNDCCSASTDGQVLWWDSRNMSKPKEKLFVDLCMKDSPENALGAISLDFETTTPTRFLVGTVQGLVISYDLESKTPEETVRTYSGHHGPICAVQRNPFFQKYFLTVADWKVRIWCEDIQESPVMLSKYHMSYLSDGCWSPVRPSVVFTVKMDGTLDIWDYMLKQNEPTLSLKVCDEGLCSIQAQNNGRFLGCSSQLGTVTVFEISPGLCTLQKNEKELTGKMFELERKWEMSMEARYKKRHLKERYHLEQSNKSESTEEQQSAKDLVACVEDEFFEIVQTEINRRAEEDKKKKKTRSRTVNIYSTR